MTMMLQRKRFYSQTSNVADYTSNSSCTSSSELPLSGSSGHSSCSINQSQTTAVASPPSSGNGNTTGYDYSRRHATPTRTYSYSPTMTSKKRVPSHSISDSNLHHNQYYASQQQQHHHQQQHQLPSYASTPPAAYASSSSASPYGMLNPGPYCRKQPRHGNHNSNNKYSVWITRILTGLAFGCLALYAISTHQTNSRLEFALQWKDHEFQQQEDHVYDLERQISRLHSDKLRLRDQVIQLETNPTQPSQEEVQLQRQVFHLQHTQELLQQGIALQSKASVQQKFGLGPKYYVELKLQFDPASNIVQDATTEIGDTILLETAFLEDMPHTLHIFLEQVEAGLFDGAVFYRNSPTVVQAGPNGNSALQTKLTHQHPELSRIMISEFAPAQALHHQQYTLGYATSSRKPLDFYVNMQDNQALHGPESEMEKHHPMGASHAAEPCFARIIRGFDIMERLHRATVKEQLNLREDQHLMQVPILIQHMRVLRDFDPTATATTQVESPAPTNSLRDTSMV